MARKLSAKTNPLHDMTNSEHVHFSADDESAHHVAMTAILDVALQTGISLLPLQDAEVPGQDEPFSIGDPDADPSEV